MSTLREEQKQKGGLKKEDAQVWYGSIKRRGEEKGEINAKISKDCVYRSMEEPWRGAGQDENWAAMVGGSARLGHWQCREGKQK